MKMKCTAILCLRHINVRKPLWRHRLGERKGIMNSWNETGKVWGHKFNAWRLPKILFKAHKGESTQYQETLIYCNLFGWEQRRTGNWTASFLVSGPVWVCNLCRTSSQFTAGLQNNLSSNAGQSISPFHAILCTKEKKKKSGGSHTSEGEIRKMLSTSVRSPIQTINQRFIFPFIAGAANSFRRREHYHILTSVSSSFLQI